MTGSANPTHDPADPRVMTGEAWDAFCESLKQVHPTVATRDVSHLMREYHLQILRINAFVYRTRQQDDGTPHP